MSGVYTITRHGRGAWAIYDPAGELLVVTCYLRGAREVVRRMETYAGALAAIVDAADTQPFACIAHVVEHVAPQARELAGLEPADCIRGAP